MVEIFKVQSPHINVMIIENRYITQLEVGITVIYLPIITYSRRKELTARICRP